MGRALVRSRGAFGKRKPPVLSVCLYALAAALLLYTVWVVKHSVSYIAAMVAGGQLTVSCNEYSIVSFYMSNCSQYALFAVVLLSLGWIAHHTSPAPALPAPMAPQAEGPVQGDDDDDFEDWFEESKEAETKT